MAPEHEAVERMHPTTGASDPLDERSTGQLLGDIVAELQTIVRKELELARHELRAAVAVRGQAAVAMAVASLFGLVALGCAVTAAAVGLSVVMPRWAAWAVMAGVFLLLAGAALVVTRSRARAAPLAPEETRRSIEENVQWVRARVRR